MLGFIVLPSQAQQPDFVPISQDNINRISLIETLPAHISTAFVDSSLVTILDSTVTQWNLSNMNNIEQEDLFTLDLTKYQSITALNISDDGELIALGTFEPINCGANLLLYSIAEANLTSLLETDLQMNGGMCRTIRDLEFSPDGKVLARPIPFFVELWDTETHELLEYLGQNDEDLIDNRGDTLDVAFSPDGTMLAAALGNAADFERTDSTIRIWNVQTDEVLAVLEEHIDSVLHVAFNADSSLLASSSADNTIRIWNTQTFKTHTIINNEFWPAHIAFIPNTNILVSEGLNGSLYFWDVDTGNPLYMIELASTDDFVWMNSLVINDEGTLIASTHNDDVLRIWGIPGSNQD